MKILIVDDDLGFCQTLKSQLDASYLLKPFMPKITFCTNGVQAIDLLKTAEFDVLIADIRLQEELEGILVLEQAIEFNPDIGRLIITGYDGDLHWAMQTQGVWRLEKPHNIHDVIIAIIRLSEPPKVQDANKILDGIIEQIQTTCIDTADIAYIIKELKSFLMEDGIRTYMQKVDESIERFEKMLDIKTSDIISVQKMLWKSVWGLIITGIATIIAVIITKLL